MKYRVTISTEGNKTDSGYQQWDEVYSQDIQDLDVAKIVTTLNSDGMRKVVRVRNRKPAAKPQARAEQYQAAEVQAEEPTKPQKASL